MDKYGYEPAFTYLEKQCPKCKKDLQGQPPVCPSCGCFPFERKENEKEKRRNPPDPRTK